MPHMVFVWTLDSVIGAIFVAGVVLLFGALGLLILLDKAKRAIRRLFSPTDSREG